MTRLNIMVLIALVCSSLYLVKVSYESRRLFAELDRAQAQALKLESDHDRLLVDARAQSTPLRVEKVARERLGMRSATPAVTEYVVVPVAAAPAPDVSELRRLAAGANGWADSARAVRAAPARAPPAAP